MSAIGIDQVKEKIEDLKSREKQPEVKELVDLIGMVVDSIGTVEVQAAGEQQAILRAIEIMEQAMDKRLEAMNDRFIAVQREIGALREEMNARFEALQREMDTRFEALQREMNARFEALRREMNARFEAMNDRFKVLMWWIPLWFTILTGVITVLLKFLL